jgi:hypothetical protein
MELDVNGRRVLKRNLKEQGVKEFGLDSAGPWIEHVGAPVNTVTKSRVVRKKMGGGGYFLTSSPANSSLLRKQFVCDIFYPENRRSMLL